MSSPVQPLMELNGYSEPDYLTIRFNTKNEAHYSYVRHQLTNGSNEVIEGFSFLKIAAVDHLDGKLNGDGKVADGDSQSEMYAFNREVVLDVRVPSDLGFMSGFLSKDVDIAE